MSEWQPIETAPKYGERVDLWRIRWVHPDPRKPDVLCEGERVAECWWDHNTRWLAKTPGSSNLIVEHEWVATHWMPAPGPPKS